MAVLYSAPVHFLHDVQWHAVAFKGSDERGTVAGKLYLLQRHWAVILTCSSEFTIFEILDLCRYQSDSLWLKRREIIKAFKAAIGWSYAHVLFEP